MNTNRAIRIIAGAFIMLSVGLSAIYNGVDLAHPTWL